MNSDRRGFTLVEALIATTILSLIVTVIYMSFATTGRNVEQAEAARDMADLARTLTSRIANDITNAYYTNAMPETIFYGASMPGDEDARFDSISLTTLSSWRRSNTKETELCEIGYRFVPLAGGHGMKLLRREKRELNRDYPPLEGGSEYLITEHVTGMQLRYYDGAAWTDGWDSRTRNALPKEVEIQLALDDGSSYITRMEVGR